MTTNAIPSFHRIFRYIHYFLFIVLLVKAQGADYHMVIIPKLQDSWFDRLNSGAQKAAKQFGIHVEMQTPVTNDQAEQIRFIQDAIEKKVNAILVVPNEASSLEPVFQQAKEKGIVVITQESPFQKNADFDIEMVDNEEFGQFAMQELAKRLHEEGEYAIYVGSMTVPDHNIWADASIQFAEENYPKLQLIGNRFPVAEHQKTAYQKTLEIFKLYPNIRGFLSYGSQGAVGAALAIQKMKKKDIVVIGMTTPNQAGKYLDDGSISELVLWDPAEAGYAMVWIAKRVLEKKSVVQGTEIPTLGKIPTIQGNTIIYNRPLRIDKTNRKEYRF